jgi:hypothetical protein
MGVRQHNGKGITKSIGTLPLNPMECEKIQTCCFASSYASTMSPVSA